MRIKNLFFSVICSICLLTSCGGDSNDKINYAIGDKTITTFIDVTADKIDTMIENDESFVAYVYSPTCSSCHDVSPRLESIIVEYGISIYRVTYSQLDKSSPLKLSTGTPILGFYKDGRKLKVIGYSEKTAQDFSTKDNLLSMFEKYVVLPRRIFYISLDELKRMKSAGESFVVLFTRSSCGDCQELFRVFLNDYAMKNRQKSIYLLECDVEGIRFSLEGDSLVYDQNLWLTFKEEWELSSTANEEFGYNAGYVPTFQYYEDGVLSASNVYLNDTYESNTTSTLENGKTINYTITITESFFDDLIGTSFNTKIVYNEETINRELYLAYRSNVISFHNQKLNEFLNQYA